jgi:CRP-like cAMP-binding protein
MPIEDASILRTIPLFALFDDDAIAALASRVHHRGFLAGQMIFAQGDPGNEMFLVHYGKVELFFKNATDDPISIGVMGPGNLFGELAALDLQPRSAAARALENTQLVVVSRDDLLALVQSNPPVAMLMMQTLAQRVRASAALVQERNIRNVNEELAAERTLSDKINDTFIRVVSSNQFIIFNIVLYILWLLDNSGKVHLVPVFDAPPFGLLTVLMSVEMIFISLFILIKQNRQAANDRVRNDIEYDVNIRAEEGIRSLGKQVETLQDLLIQHLTTLETFQKAQQIKQIEDLRD